MATVTANGITIAYEQQGNGPDLLLITGVGYGGWFWHKVAPLLADHFRVTTFDNRGAGGSDKPAGPYTVEMMAADTAALLDALNIERAAVLGHSLGGYIAQLLVVNRPELVNKLILAGTNFGGQGVIPITPAAMSVLTNRQGEPMELIRRGIDIAAAPGLLERQAHLAEELIAYRLTNPVPPAQYTAQVMAGAGTWQWTANRVDRQMAAIQIPTLILFGEFDQVVPPGNADLLAAKIPQAEIKILPNGGHIFPLELPQETAEIVKRFLS
jgi:pimeloyl-ACP methyl ester carboxylesterase